mmetsp:Transcript_23951/g.60427  ORF Transcript_23951/g.60427 Transcript_23951/m.60427 type:complete len:80 (-) Transcript_23951:104-343(-)
MNDVQNEHDIGDDGKEQENEEKPPHFRTWFLLLRRSLQLPRPLRLFLCRSDTYENVEIEDLCMYEQIVGERRTTTSTRT